MQIITTGTNENIAAICNSFTCGRISSFSFLSRPSSRSSVRLPFLFSPLFHFISRTVNSFRIKSRPRFLSAAREPPIRFLSYPYRGLFPPSRAARYILSTTTALTMILNNTRGPPPHLLNVRGIPLALSAAGNIAECFSRVLPPPSCRRGTIGPSPLSEINTLNS